MSKLLLFAAVLFSCVFSQANANVCVYADTNYRGDALCLNAGQSIADLSQKGFNKRISSIRVDGLVTLVMYSGNGFTGSTLQLVGNTPDLNARRWNDVASSIKALPSDARVCFFEDINYSGAAFCRGIHFEGDLTDTGWNDRVSSVRIDGDASVYAYMDVGYGGRMLWINKSTANLGVDWNDKISSILTYPARGR